MSKFAKLVERFCNIPNDFTYDELRVLLHGFGYREWTKGKTSGSRVAFLHEKTHHVIRLHKPHPGNILKKYQMVQIYEGLQIQGFIK